MKRRFITIPRLIAAIAIAIFIAAVFLFVIYYSICACFEVGRADFTQVETLAGGNGEFIEPFGIALKNNSVYVSDGETGKIWRIANGAAPVIFAENLHTPSAIAFDKNGDLIVADPGSHTIKRIDNAGTVTLVAGTENEPGDVNGDVLSARFNAPIGIAVRDDGAIVVADTYNDKIKIIKDGVVRALAGTNRGFADGSVIAAQFDTPCGIAAWTGNRIVVADTANNRLRVVEPDGATWTLAGTDDRVRRDGSLLASGFVQPTAVASGPNGELFISDGSTIRAIRGRSFPFAETLSSDQSGYVDGTPRLSAFNRASGLAVDENNNLIVADSDNGVVRIFRSGGELGPPHRNIVEKKVDPADFRLRQPARWPYDPPEAKRDVAGTLGEIRGELVDDESGARFHNGLDIAGGYGETAYFIRSEKVLQPLAAENFETSRELVRMPTLGYIHIRLGRDSSNKTYEGRRFQFSIDDAGKLNGLRIPRGSRFAAGEKLGTLNSQNHVHLIAGPRGDEMNALDALIFPGISDSISPVIENVTLFDENWLQIETPVRGGRIIVNEKSRIVVRAYDRMDGNAERRRLGVYRLGYQVFVPGQSPAAVPDWNINFDRNPASEAVTFAYAQGSRSGATGETVFNYIVTNMVNGDSYRESFLDTATFGSGIYTLRVFAADFFGNIASKDISVEVTK